MITSSSPIENFWKPYDGQTVEISGLKCIIKVDGYEARYPYPRRVSSVVAIPTEDARRMPYYRTTRRELGDDWMFDLLTCAAELQEEVLAQLP